MRRTLYGLIVLILFSFCLTRSFMPGIRRPPTPTHPGPSLRAVCGDARDLERGDGRDGPG